MQKNRKENETVFEIFVVNPLYTTALKKVLAKSEDQDEITHISPIDQDETTHMSPIEQDEITHMSRINHLIRICTVCLLFLLLSLRWQLGPL